MWEVLDDERNIYVMGYSEEDALLRAKQKYASVCGVPLEEVNIIEHVGDFVMTHANGARLIYKIRRSPYL